jgi:hypothetical protein
MRSYEVPDEKWITFFNGFSRDHAGWPATLEVLDGGTGPQRLAADLPLQGISFDPGGTRPCTIQIGAGDSPEANMSHTVDLPLHIRVAEPDDAQGGDEITIQIQPARGATTLVRLHSPVH